MGNKVTYTGCLKPGTTPGTWMLESAALSTGATSSTDRAVGTSGVASSETFMLTSKPSDNLKPHANHKIEVVGVVSPAASSGMSSPSTQSSPGAQSSSSATASSSTPRQTITIDSFKMVSATCP
jgi:hypothetical protein